MNYTIPPYDKVLEDRAKVLEERRLREEAERVKRIEEEKIRLEKFEKEVEGFLVQFVEDTRNFVDRKREADLEVVTEACARLVEAGWPARIKRTYKATHVERCEMGFDRYSIFLD